MHFPETMMPDTDPIMRIFLERLTEQLANLETTAAGLRQELNTVQTTTAVQKAEYAAIKEKLTQIDKSVEDMKKTLASLQSVREEAPRYCLARKEECEKEQKRTNALGERVKVIEEWRANLTGKLAVIGAVLVLGVEVLNFVIDHLTR